ncbi:MAG: siroheme decarboxylase, partial [Thermoleophilaceae bacterium]|nr:siroheme decarboxylase [Thermoleophilaceae bacterium]
MAPVRQDGRRATSGSGNPEAAARQPAQPKLRSRKHGAAVPLDELDKKLLNLMQGSFPIEPRPYLRVAELADVSEDEVMSRVRHLL